MINSKAKSSQNKSLQGKKLTSSFLRKFKGKVYRVNKSGFMEAYLEKQNNEKQANKQNTCANSQRSDQSDNFSFNSKRKSRSVELPRKNIIQKYVLSPIQEEEFGETINEKKSFFSQKNPHMKQSFSIDKKYESDPTKNKKQVSDSSIASITPFQLPTLINKKAFIGQKKALEPILHRKQNSKTQMRILFKNKKLGLHRLKTKQMKQIQSEDEKLITFR